MQDTGSRAAWMSVAVSTFLSLLNLAIAAASGSLAVAAEMIHNLVDLAASVAVLAGVKISARKSRDFPYGLYKVENVVAVGLAILILFTGYEVAKAALLAEERQTTVDALILCGVALSAVIPFFFGAYEMRVGRRLNSPSLLADGQEYRAHVLSSGVVFLALLCQLADLSLDRYAALAVVLFIAKTGWELLTSGVRVLLDASLDAETLGQVRAIIQREPLVADVRSLVGRNTGRYRFLEAEVALRTADLDKAHAASDRLEKEIRTRVPHVERVLLHLEPRVRARQCYAVPLADPGGTVSQHFGEAPYFALVDVAIASGQVERQEIVPNPHAGEEKGRGILVAEWLVGLKVDAVLLRRQTEGRGPTYVFADAGVETLVTAAEALAEAIAEQSTPS